MSSMIEDPLVCGYHKCDIASLFLPLRSCLSTELSLKQITTLNTLHLHVASTIPLKYPFFPMIDVEGNGKDFSYSFNCAHVNPPKFTKLPRGESMHSP